jgi:hypothetical protein
VREALWWKLGKKGLSTKFIEGVKGVYKNVRITVKLEGYRVLEGGIRFKYWTKTGMYTITNAI